MDDALAILLCLFKLFTSALAFCINIVKGLINFLLGILHIKQIKNTNTRNRGVISGGTCKANQVFSSGGHHNYVISGGSVSVRSRLVKGVIDNTSTFHMPVVILHQGNTELERLFSNSQIGRNVLCINPSNPCYEPLHGRSNAEVARVLIEAAPDKYDIKANAEEFVLGLLEYRKALNGSQKLSWLAECPFSDMFNRLDARENSGAISTNDANLIRSKLLAGQSELYKIRRYVQDLNQQIGSIIVPKQSRINGYSILDCLNSDGIVLIDVLNSSNYLTIDLILKEIELFAQSGRHVCFVTESIDIQENGSLYKLIKAKHRNCSTVVSADDLFALTNADDKVFHTILGNSECFAILRHTSGASAQKWSEAIGYYDKIEVTTSSGSSRTQQVAKFFPLYGSSTTTNYTNKRESIVKQEEIIRMRDNEAYVYDVDTSSMSHVSLI